MSRLSVLSFCIAAVLFVTDTARSQEVRITKLQEFKSRVSKAYVRPDGKMVVICYPDFKNEVTIFKVFDDKAKILHERELRGAFLDFAFAKDWSFVVVGTSSSSETDYAIDLKSGKVTKQKKREEEKEKNPLKSPDGTFEAIFESSAGWKVLRVKKKGVEVLNAVEPESHMKLTESSAYGAGGKTLMTTWSYFSDTDGFGRRLSKPEFWNGVVLLHDLTTGKTLHRHLPWHSERIDRECIEACVAAPDGTFLVLTRTQGQEKVLLYRVEKK